MRFKSYLLSLGVSDPVTKSAFGNGAIYYEKLAEELAAVLLEPLKVCILFCLKHLFVIKNEIKYLCIYSFQEILF